MQGAEMQGVSEFSQILSFVIPLIICGIVGLFVYFIPSFTAYKKNHVQKKAILILNIFLGWTFVGWVVALIWSVLKNTAEPQQTKTE